jgi:acyl carrier protein
MNTTLDIESRVIDVVAQALKQPVDRASLREDIAAWDSLRHIEIVFAIEDELQIRFDEDELAALDGVQALIDCARSKA